MRIISGKHRGKRLIAPKNLPVRPTTDMAKEALFNILTNSYSFDALTVIDLFCGTGNISFEFASRGTKEIYAIDWHFGCLGFVSAIAKELNYNINTYKKDVYKFLGQTSLKVDIIFADPPYNFEINQFLQIATLIFEKNLLNKDGILIIEHSKHTNLSTHPHFSSARKYGNSSFSFFKLGYKTYNDLR